MNKKLIILPILLFIVLPVAFSALQDEEFMIVKGLDITKIWINILNGSTLWNMTGTELYPLDSTANLKIPTLTSCSSVITDANGLMSCGVGGAATAWQLENFTMAYDSRNDRWLLSNFTAALENRLTELYNDDNLTTKYPNLDTDSTDDYVTSDFQTDYDTQAYYKKANLTIDYPNLDTDSTDDYATSNFQTDYDTQAYYKKGNLTIDYPNLDTDSTDDLDLGSLENDSIIRVDNTTWRDEAIVDVAPFWNLANNDTPAFLSHLEGRLAEFYSDTNLTTKYPSLDIDSTDDYLTANFLVDYENQAYWKLLNYTDLEDNAFRIINFTTQLDLFIPHFWELENFTSAFDTRLNAYMPELWELENFTASYDARIGEYQNESSAFNTINYTALEDAAFRNENFTVRYDLKTDRWLIANLTSYLTNNNIDIGGGFSSGGITLETDGDIWMNGSLYILGNISNVDVANLNINGSLYPTIDDTFDIGSANLQWKDGYFSGTVDANSFTGDGSGLTSLPYGELTGVPDTTDLDIWNVTQHETALPSYWEIENASAYLTAQGYNKSVMLDNHQLKSDIFTISNYSAEYANSGYKKANLTTDYPNLDTDSTDDYATSDFTTDLEGRLPEFYSDANLTTDHPNLDTDSTDDYTTSDFQTDYDGQHYFKCVNMTSCYANLDTDSTDDYVTSDFQTDYDAQAYYKKANLTTDYPNLDTDKTDDQIEAAAWKVANASAYLTAQGYNKSVMLGDYNWSLDLSNYYTQAEADAADTDTTTDTDLLDILNVTNFEAYLPDFWKIENSSAYLTTEGYNKSIEHITINEDQIIDLTHYTDADIDGTETAFNGWDKNELDGYTDVNLTTDYPNLDTDKTDDQIEAAAWKVANSTAQGYLTSYTETDPIYEAEINETIKVHNATFKNYIEAWVLAKSYITNTVSTLTNYFTKAETLAHMENNITSNNESVNTYINTFDSSASDDMNYENITTKWSNLDTDSTDDYTASDYFTEYSSSGYHKANLTLDYPNLDTDSTDDVLKTGSTMTGTLHITDDAVNMTGTKGGKIFMECGMKSCYNINCSRYICSNCSNGIFMMVNEKPDEVCQ